MTDILDTEGTAKILDYEPGYIRELCGKEDMREILGASKMGRFWIFEKSKVEAYRDKIAATRRKKKKKKKKKEERIIH